MRKLAQMWFSLSQSQTIVLSVDLGVHVTVCLSAFVLVIA